jgi:hypothetical protein
MKIEMKSNSTLPKSFSARDKEFAGKTGSKRDAVKKAEKADRKSDKAIAKRFGVKVKK